MRNGCLVLLVSIHVEEDHGYFAAANRQICDTVSASATHLSQVIVDRLVERLVRGYASEPRRGPEHS